MKLFNKLLAQAPLFKDSVVAIANITKSLNDTIKAYTQLAKIVTEDRQAINDLYQLFADMQAEKLHQFVGQSAEKPVKSSDSGRLDTTWSEGDKKKLSN